MQEQKAVDFSSGPLEANVPSAYEKQSSATKLTSPLLIAALAATFGLRQRASTRPRKPIPTMECSPREEIVAWNKAASKRSDRHVRTAKRRADRNTERAFADSGQRPKFAKERQHRQHKHELRDEHGAYTLTGSVYTLEGEGVRPSSREHVLGGVFCGPGQDEHSEYTARRKWLAGISAQRGF